MSFIRLASQWLQFLRPFLSRAQPSLPLLLQRFPRGHRHWQQPLVGQFLRELGYQVLFVKEQSFLRLLLRLPPTELAIL
jgi:hypothetical protein